MSEVLAHRSRALTPAETEELLRDRLGDGILRSVVEYGMFTLWIDPAAWVETATHCRDERLLAYEMFDTLFGVDAREEGFDVVAVLYSPSTGNRIVLRSRCEGGREAPSLPSLTEVYRGANWMERETYDMFGIDFTGHPGLEPRILTVENFEGFPLRKDFHLAARVAKPWPGVAEPVELDEDGNVIEREVGLGDAPGPYELDKAMAAQAQQVNAPPAEEPEAAAADSDTDAEVAASATAGGPTVATGVPAGESTAAESTAGEAPVDEAPVDEAPVDEAPVDEARATRAKAKAEERRRKQAEARAAKAKARAERTAGGDAPAGPETATTPGDATDEPAPAPATAPADTSGDAGAAAGAAAPADTAGGSTAAGTSDTADEPAEDDGPDTTADEAPKAGGPGDEPAAATSAPEDDRAARAKAKAEERRRKQAELRAARAKARAERSEGGEDGEDDA